MATTAAGREAQHRRLVQVVVVMGVGRKERAWTRWPSLAEQSEAGAAAMRDLENLWPVVRGLGGHVLHELEAR